MTNAPTHALPKENIQLRVDQYVRLRDLKSELAERHKAEMGPFNEAMKALEEIFLREMNNLNVTSLKTSAGTVSQKKKESASCADLDAFWTHVVTQGDFDLVDKKPNVTGVRDYIDKNGVAPPGVNWSSVVVASVRRA